MLKFKMNRNTYFIVCIIILLLTLCIIIQVNADKPEQPPLPKEKPPQLDEHGTLDNTNSDSIKTEHILALLQPFILIFRILYALISYIWTFILYVFSPVFWVLSALYNVFILTPYTITQKINSYFYPLYMFLVTAALFGILIGGMAGWLSEVIVKFMIPPTSDGLTYDEQENNRINSERLNRRAQALANLRARNGGRITDEFYNRYRQQKMMESYGTNQYYNNYSNYNNNMDYRSYAGTGVGDS
ncbi:hypothetical protein C1645_386798 [Glomus cerebriforme]|uniref:Uncharacterized protein n=1 Tax=Glomus cerebriforme TaxID=658196 RepID=A0A397SG22_9GLOM|nr:hypothetical protein C1645_386798 [Glomus cerebriforme]